MRKNRIIIEVKNLVIGMGTVILHIPGANSLKDKRRVLKSLLQRARARFNVSLAEIDDQDTWRRVTLGIACVSNESGHAYQNIQAVINFIADLGEVEIIDYNMQVL